MKSHTSLRTLGDHVQSGLAQWPQTRQKPDPGSPRATGEAAGERPMTWPRSLLYLQTQCVLLVWGGWGLP